MSLCRTILALAIFSAPLSADLPPARQVEDLRTEPDRAAFRGAEPRQLFELDSGTLLSIASARDGSEVWFLDRLTGEARRAVAPCASDGQLSFGQDASFRGRVGERALMVSPCGSGLIWSTDGTSAGTEALLRTQSLDARGTLADGSALFLSSGQLWHTEGTAAETEPIAFLEAEFQRDDLETWARLGDRIVFAATEQTRGNEPWVSDGTAAGTELLRDLAPSSEGSSPAGFAPLDDRVVVFFAQTPTGKALWRTDGTANGTFAVTTGSLLFHSPLFVGRGRAYFFGFRGQGAELFSTDGTARGTTSLSVARFDYANGRRLAAVFGNRLYWTETVDSRRLFTSDGTSQGTLVINLRLGDRFADYFRPTPFGLLILASQTVEEPGVWLLDGVPEPKKLASACSTAPCDAGFVLPRSTGRASSYVFFEAPFSNEGEIRLWRTDGTAPETRPFATLPDAGLVHQTFQGNVLPTDSQLLTVSRQDSVPRFLWYHTDGTAAGTRVALDLSALDGPGSSHARNLTAVGNRLAFAARPEDDFYVYVSLKEASGTMRLSNVEVDDRLVDRDEVLTPLGSSRLIVRQDLDFDGVNDLLVSDGTPEGTTALTGASNSNGFRPWAFDHDFLVVDQHTLFRSDLANGSTLEPLGELAREQSFFEDPSWVSWNGATYFLHFGGLGEEGDTALWRTDGTAPGTVVIDRGPFTDLRRWSGGLVAKSGKKLFFSNGLPGGSYYLEGPWTFNVVRLVPTAGPLFFTVEGELWRTDGTAAGTLSVGGLSSVGFSPLVAFGSRIVFAIEDAAAGNELWISDGDPANTRRLFDLWPGVAGSQPNDLAVIGDRLYFRANDGRHGWEVWVTDGTVGGTSRLTDLAPGIASSHPRYFTRFGDEIGFVADDGLTGGEVWAVPADAVGEPFVPGPEPVPPGEWLTAPEIPGFRFKVHFGRFDFGVPGNAETVCLAETLCVSGAVPGRVEVLVRVVGPKPNGFLWPTLAKLTTSQVQVWIEQAATGAVRYYLLPGSRRNVDELPSLFDRTGFLPSRLGFEGSAASIGDKQPPPPQARWLTSPELPGFRVAVQLAVPGGTIGGRAESRCLDETLCVSGALGGRSELLVRVVGPRPNGFLWPTLARFTTSAIDVWIEQTRTRVRRHYRLEGATPGRDDLTGLFDREGFQP